MKKRLIAALAAASMMAAAVPCACASYSEDVTVYVNGEMVDSGQYKPLIVNDRTMVRLVPIFEALGYTYGDLDKYNSVSFTKKGTNTVYRFIAEQNYAVVGTGYDEEEVMSGRDTSRNSYFDVPATLQYYDVFYVPVRAFCEIAGVDIAWDEDTRSVYIVDADSLIGTYTASANDEPMAGLEITKAGDGSLTFAYSRRHTGGFGYSANPAYFQPDGAYVADGEYSGTRRDTGEYESSPVTYVLFPKANGHIRFEIYDKDTGEAHDIAWDFIKTSSSVEGASGASGASGTSDAAISAGNYRAYDSAGEGIANLDVTSTGADRIMITYDYRGWKDYNIGNATAVLDNGVYVAAGENRKYVLTPLDADSFSLTIIEGADTVVDNLVFKKL